MKKIVTILGILTTILTVILVILFLLRVENIKLGYCILSMIVCLVVWGIRKALKE